MILVPMFTSIHVVFCLWLWLSKVFPYETNKRMFDLFRCLISLRNNIKRVGQMGASSSIPSQISKHLLPAARWLESHDLAVLNERNQLVLSDSAIQTTTLLSSPSLVRNPSRREDQSLWSLRKELLGQGWTMATAESSPSIHGKVANGRNACKLYFTILLDSPLLQHQRN